jgi:hypothetical protein
LFFFNNSLIWRRYVAHLLSFEESAVRDGIFIYRELLKDRNLPTTDQNFRDRITAIKSKDLTVQHLKEFFYNEFDDEDDVAKICFRLEKICERLDGLQINILSEKLKYKKFEKGQRKHDIWTFYFVFGFGIIGFFCLYNYFIKIPQDFKFYFFPITEFTYSQFILFNIVIFLIITALLILNLFTYIIQNRYIFRNSFCEMFEIKKILNELES